MRITLKTLTAAESRNETIKSGIHSWSPGQESEGILALFLAPLGVKLHRNYRLKFEGEASKKRSGLSISETEFGIQRDFFAFNPQSAFCDPQSIKVRSIFDLEGEIGYNSQYV